jgi:hypothetical protein
MSRTMNRNVEREGIADRLRAPDFGLQARSPEPGV